MKSLKIILALIVLLAAPALAQEMGTSAGHDLDALWARAQQNNDLENEDAVLLLESRTITVGDEGTLVTRVHQVVWISTSRGIRSYADLRVPWNSATSTLDVEILRTWMDGRWWPDAQQISETAVVHTLPYAVNHADQYTTMRETMLLHDGVELPCIMETAYTIAEQGTPTAGADGLFVFARRDPAVKVEYIVRAPLGIDVAQEALNGAPQAVVESNGVESLAWTMEDVPALALPIAAQPAAYEPAVAWSTWESMDALEAVWQETIDAAAVADPVLTDLLDERLAGSLDPVRDIVAFWNEAVRPIHYPFRFWQLAPRPATRTWETGYGHALDRAVLLAALLRHYDADLAPDVVRTTAGYDGVASDLPRLAGFDGLRVETRGGRLGTWMIDPDSGRIEEGEQLGRWPTTHASHHGQHLYLSLAPDKEEAWTGAGALAVGNSFGPALYGDAAAVRSRVERAVGSVLPGAEIGEIAHADNALRFTVSLAELPLNADEEPALVLGRLNGGLMARLPGDIHLHEEQRQSPLAWPRSLVESVELRLQVEEREFRAPEPAVFQEPFGSFRVEVAHEHGWLRVTQKLDLDAAGGNRTLVEQPAAAWPALRTLLLEAADPIHGTIVLE